MKTLLLIPFVLIASCYNPAGNPKMASSIYPMELHTATSVPIQVIRDGEYISIVNSTAIDYDSPTLWVNQRYSSVIQSLPAGSTLRFNLKSLRDAYGEQINAGGIWRTDEPTTLVIAELQLSDESPLVGLIVIHEEE